jgi:hypothetical protein
MAKMNSSMTKQRSSSGGHSQLESCAQLQQRQRGDRGPNLIHPRLGSFSSGITSEEPDRTKCVDYCQSIDDTIVQLFVSQTSVLMTRVDRLQSETSKPGQEKGVEKMVLTSHDVLGNTGLKTGFELEEFAAPYFVFRNAGVC